VQRKSVQHKRPRDNKPRRKRPVSKRHKRPRVSRQSVRRRKRLHDNKPNVQRKRRLHVSRQSKPLPQHAPRNKLPVNKLRVNRPSLQRRPALVRKRRSHGKMLSALAATKKPVVPRSSADLLKQPPPVAHKKKLPRPPRHKKLQGKKPRVRKPLVLHRNKPQPSVRRRSFASRNASEQQLLFVNKKLVIVPLARKRARRLPLAAPRRRI
jgi:hypothetical protein